MLPEYDFTGGVRGKHHKTLREGYTVKISQADGTTLYQVELWDRQIEEVLAVGRLDALLAEVEQEHAAGLSRPL